MKKISLLIALVAVLFSCKKEKTEEPIVPSTPSGFLNGVFIVNEGAFSGNQGEVSYVGTSGTIQNELYFTQNEVELGDVLQSFTIIGSKGYAVVNNSSKIEVVDMSNFKHSATITNIDYPRYLLSVGSGKAYLTSGSTNGFVKVLDLNSNSITASIPVGNGPDHLIMANDRVFVCNNGGFLSDSTLSVINTSTQTLEATIEVGDTPNNVVKDSNGHLWVLCSGKTVYDANWNVIGHSPAGLYHIDPSSLLVVEQYVIGSLGDHPSKMAISANGNDIYFENHGVYHFNISQPSTYDLVVAGEHGALGIQPSNGHIWLGSVSTYFSSDTIFEYSGSTLLHQYVAGIGANAILFN